MGNSTCYNIKAMNYKNIVEAKFIKRPNRFIAFCETDGKEVVAHVRNTGRCRELLIPGTTVYLEKSQAPKRKTGYSLVSVMKGERIVNIDSIAPNKVMKEALENGLDLPELGRITLIRPEARFYDSRFDFYLEAGDKRALVEVKGVTLEVNGLALFPDAPTERGVRHVEELIRAKADGFLTYLVFIVQMKGVHSFTPNAAMHPAFDQAVKMAIDMGVHVLCYDCNAEKDSLALADPVRVI